MIESVLSAASGVISRRRVALVTFTGCAGKSGFVRSTKSALPLCYTPNPALGRRGVRLLLDYPQLVRTQMGAILRLAQEHLVRVLVPMVTLEEDVRRMRETFDALCAKRRVKSPPAFGAMVETPAAALAVPTLAGYVDFFSVGTNDLTPEPGN